MAILTRRTGERISPRRPPDLVHRPVHLIPAPGRFVGTCSAQQRKSRSCWGGAPTTPDGTPQRNATSSRACDSLARRGDSIIGGRLLANLSHQANYLGHHNDAVRLARAAQAATGNRATPAVTSMFLAMEARALANGGHAKEFARVITQAERIFERHSPDDEPEWIRYFNAEELAGEAAHGFRDLGRPEETRLFAARAVAPAATPPRTRAFIGMVTAAGAMTNGDPDEAVALALDAVDLAGPLQSSRYVRYLTDFYDALNKAHPKNPLVGQLAEGILRHYPNLTLGSAIMLSRVA